MGTKKGWRGEQYDDKYPLFVEVHPDYVIHVSTMQTLKKDSVIDAMAAEQYIPNSGEIGFSADWEKAHEGWWTRDALHAGGGAHPQPPTINPVTGLPITGDSGGTQSVEMDLDFHGTVKAGTFTVTYDIGGGNETVTASLDAD